MAYSGTAVPATLSVAGRPYAIFLVFFAHSLVAMLAVSSQTGRIGGPWALSNYTNFLSLETYLTVAWRTFLISVALTAVVTVVGYALAWNTGCFSRRTTLLFLLVILSLWINYIIRKARGSTSSRGTACSTRCSSCWGCRR